MTIRDKRLTSLALLESGKGSINTDVAVGQSLLVAMFFKSSSLDSCPFFRIQSALNVHIWKQIGRDGVKSEGRQTGTTRHLCNSTSVELDKASECNRTDLNGMPPAQMLFMYKTIHGRATKASVITLS